MLALFLWTLAATAPPSDGKLLQLLHAAHLSAVAAANEALLHSGRTDVKRYAQELREGHGAAEKAVEAAAGRLAVTLVEPSTDGATAEEVADLSHLQGAAFDRAFARTEVAAHARILSDLETLTPTLGDALIKKLAASEGRALRALEQKARRLDDAL